jgi:hypothetical protein
MTWKGSVIPNTLMIFLYLRMQIYCYRARTGINLRMQIYCYRAHSQSTTAYRWNDVMILISKWRFTEGSNKGKFVNLRLKLYIKRSQNNVILLVWIWQMSIVHFWQAFEGFHHLIRSGNEMIRNFWQENYWLMALTILLWNYESNDSSTCWRCRCISSCKCWCLCTSQFNIFIGDFNKLTLININ